MPRGIQNVSGVSCHISCALQILCHVVTPLSHALQEVARLRPPSTFAEWHVVWEFAHLFQQLHEHSDSPVDVTRFYRSLAKTSSNSVVLNPDDVGDVAQAVYQLLELLRNTPLANLIEKTVGSGRTQQVFRGSILQKQSWTHRTKTGKNKTMGCPFPLVGNPLTDISQALLQITRPISVPSYKWESANPDTYKEHVEKVVAGTTYDPKTIEEGAWTTTKSIKILSLPSYFLLSLQRFSYDPNDSEKKILINPSVTIPEQIDLSRLTTGSEESPQAVWILRGGVLHVSEGSIEEEGHFVSILRGKQGDDEDSWTIIDDESCHPVDDTKALQLLAGHKDELDGKYYCATLVAYEAAEPDENNNDNNNNNNYYYYYYYYETPTVVAEMQKLFDESPVHDETPQALVGRRLKVRWAKGKAYAGVVSAYEPISGMHRVCYDDGDVKEYILSQKNIEWL